MSQRSPSSRHALRAQYSAGQVTLLGTRQDHPCHFPRLTVLVHSLRCSRSGIFGVQPIRDQVFEGMCPDFLLGYPGIKVTQMLDLSNRGVDLVHLEDGRHSDRFRSLAAHLVHHLHVALPGPFLISSKDPNTT
ncbi:hypothetical protein TIFTF001_039815 [Ficus carica]|uniref:Uncharacterized protein n=1 Tax=Ficus carica TaxID=3494 RepID=A0AA87Z7J4_FICCA|nr:hypothetical protein TIFTF001_039802 [Ficus carica]GMN19433.1 hypothetical protein TIFTF001_039805 [Ficus carica]GMN19446.1 hypothetical protein TIFTF001_039812 [Ficus carica]GMN19465.1 hypothetical protein TIFTF001_039815 [Ficus carica]